METWIHDEILDGLSKLLCLSLERTPAADMIQGTAMAWTEAVTFGKAWEPDDRARFRSAFLLLASTRYVWPAPRHFIEAIPARDQLAIARESRKADPARAASACAEIASALSIDRKTAAAGPDA